MVTSDTLPTNWRSREHQPNARGNMIAFPSRIRLMRAPRGAFFEQQLGLSIPEHSKGHDPDRPTANRERIPPSPKPRRKSYGGGASKDGNASHDMQPNDERFETLIPDSIAKQPGAPFPLFDRTRQD
jgi:hypothetical protein